MQKSSRQRKTYSPEKFTGRNYRPYVIALGQLALAWNDLHEDIALLFIELLANGRAYPATDIWNSANFDRPRRAMLKAVIGTQDDRFKRCPKLAEDVTWLLDEADKLEDARNDAIHSPLTTFTPDNFGSIDHIAPSLAFDNRRAMKLARKDLLTEFRWCRDASLVLRDFAEQIYEAVAARTAWPDRPSLPNRGQKKRRQNQPPPIRAK
jgi:hypothetical protein